MEVGVGLAGGEVEEVVDEEGEDDGAAPVHGAGGVSGGDGCVADVGDGAGGDFELGELEGAEDVGEDAEGQDGAGAPEERGVVLKGFGVGVEGVFAIGAWREVELQIAQHVAENEGDQDEA